MIYHLSFSKIEYGRVLTNFIFRQQNLLPHYAWTAIIILCDYRDLGCLSEGCLAQPQVSCVVFIVVGFSIALALRSDTRCGSSCGPSALRCPEVTRVNGVVNCGQVKRWCLWGLVIATIARRKNNTGVLRLKRPILRGRMLLAVPLTWPSVDKAL